MVKNAEPSKNGTAADLSDLSRMIQRIGDSVKQVYDNLKQKMDDAFKQQQQKINNGLQQLFDKISAVELSTKTNSDTVAIHSNELSNHSRGFDALDTKSVSFENKIDTEIASMNS